MKNRKYSRLFLFFLLLFVISLLTACGKGKDEGNVGGGVNPPETIPAPAEHEGNAKPDPQPEQPKKSDPYSLLVYAPGVSSDEFDTRFRGTLETRFPHVTFDYIGLGGPGIKDMVAQGTIPDIYRIDIPTFRSNYLDMDMGYDLRDLIKQYNYDLTRFNHSFVQEFIDVAQTGAIYGLPVPPYFPNVLYYNKDLFDKFGVPAPVDGMNWDDVVELARLMSRSEGGEVFRGFSGNLLGMLRDNPFSVPILDPSRDGLAEESTWQRIFTEFMKLYTIPNNKIGDTIALEGAAFNTGKVAMQAHLHSVYLVLPEEIDWDIVSFPTMNGAPAVTSQRGPAYWSITSTNKHKEESFEVIMEMLSDEIQTTDSRMGIPSTLADTNVNKVLGSDHPIYSQKNMGAVHYHQSSTPTPKRKSDLIDIPLSQQASVMQGAFHNAAIGNSDINTALREANEKLVQLVNEEKEKQGK